MRHLIIALAITGLLSAVPVSAANWFIKDQYVGGGYTPGGKYTMDVGNLQADVISASTQINKFNIDNMIVDINSTGIDGQIGDVTITITTDYNPNDRDIRWLGTQFGDLFISVDGWAPDTTAPNYSADTYGLNATTGNDWEYVFDTSTGNFYKTNDGAFLLSQDFHSNRPDFWYRKDQIVQIDPTKILTDSITMGTFKMAKDALGHNVLTYYGFNLTDMDLDLNQSYDLAFRWAMTCANDVIEGTVTWQPVPEPGTMMLFGLGLLGLSLFGRRRLATARTKRRPPQPRKGQIL